tara:strand:+ start:154 stop:1038 length:885 start_codon:yes stop_codon:yes gene_type:complete
MSNSALLYTDILKENFWDAVPSKRISFNLTSGSKNNSFPFENCFDGHSGTTWRLNSDGTQQKYTFLVTGAINGFAIYGHNLRETQGLRIINTSSSQNYFSTSPNFSSDGAIRPSDSTGRAFCAIDWSSGNISDASTALRAISIETINWDTDTFIEVFQLGTFRQSGIDFVAPFNLPLFQTEKRVYKTNENGSQLPSTYIKTPQKQTLRIKSMDFEENIISSDNNQFLVKDIVNKIKSNPFFVLWRVPRNNELGFSHIEDLNSLIYANVNGTIPNPTLDANNLINLRIPIIGFTE